MGVLSFGICLLASGGVSPMSRAISIFRTHGADAPRSPLRMLHFHQFAHVGDVTSDGGGSDHGRTHEEGSSGRAALAAFEVAVTRGSADFAAHELVRVHGETHRTPRAAPIETGFDE